MLTKKQRESAFAWKAAAEAWRASGDGWTAVAEAALAGEIWITEEESTEAAEATKAFSAAAEAWVTATNKEAWKAAAEVWQAAGEGWKTAGDGWTAAAAFILERGGAGRIALLKQAQALSADGKDEPARALLEQAGLHEVSRTADGGAGPLQDIAAFRAALQQALQDSGATDADDGASMTKTQQAAKAWAAAGEAWTEAIEAAQEAEEAGAWPEGETALFAAVAKAWMQAAEVWTVAAKGLTAQAAEAWTTAAKGWTTAALMGQAWTSATVLSQEQRAVIGGADDEAAE